MIIIIHRRLNNKIFLSIENSSLKRKFSIEEYRIIYPLTDNLSIEE